MTWLRRVLREALMAFVLALVEAIVSLMRPSQA